jgi:hypothetical protein
VRVEGGPELGVGEDGGVADAVDRVQAVADPDRVQPPPPPLREHPRVDLQVQVPMRITGPGRVVPHRHRLQLLDRNLDLTPPRTDPGGRVLGQPADHLRRGPVLRPVVGGRDVRVQRRGQRPRLRTVHHHLDEPHPLSVGPQPPFCRAGDGVVAGHPRLVGVPVQRPARNDPALGGDVPVRDTGPLGQVVVIGTRPISLHIRTGSGR